MDKPLVSIALCTYNGEKYLVEQLDSIVNQSYPNIEIIAVDDCSSDGTVDILKAYAEKYPYFQVYENEINLGYIKNFEKAIRLCTGEFIALADQDDIWHLNKIAVQVNEIGEHNLIYHDSEFINEHGISINKKISDVRRFYSGGDSRYFLFENCVSGHTILFNKRIVPFLNHFKPEIFHDWWIAYVATNTGTILASTAILVKYRQHLSTSTDILRTKKPKRADRKIADQQFLQRLKHFTAYLYNDHQKFKTHLLNLVSRKSEKKINIRLLQFIISNQKILLFMQRKGYWSKLNYARKFL